MLSVLVPIYNYNAYPLVEELHKQCIELGIVFEILCQDDASKSALNINNEKINSLSNCNFISLEKNVAHRQNRNLLAKRAKYEYLLFLDGDSIVINSHYIKNYINNLKEYDVIYGGRLHPENYPSNQQILRWKYGKFIEDKLAKDRLKKPYKCLLFNNTIIKKECFNKVKFDTEITLYGHDDTQLSYQLSLIPSKIHHIDNQIKHGDIDSNEVYINKTKNSIKSLLVLYASKKIDYRYVSLLKLYVFLKTTKLHLIASLFYKTFKNTMTKNLVSNNPSLIVFNLFRISYMCSLKQ
ncbi:MAG: glycosyltransferase [Flavobacteriaceae bacterium]|nr:MAG: glycosyltransferase [Flavobacteriaceae bacterium]